MGWNNSALFLGISVAGAVGSPLIAHLSYGGAMMIAAVIALLAAAVSVVARERGIGSR